MNPGGRPVPVDQAIFFLHHRRISTQGVVLFFGSPDLHSTRTILYHTEEDLECVLADGAIRYRFTVSWRKLRPHIEPGYRREYGVKDMETAPPAVQDVLKKTSKALLLEYGISAGNDYYAMFDAESYQLPPDGPDGEPRTRTNRILLMADAPFRDGKPPRPLSPLFQGWGY